MFVPDFTIGRQLGEPGQFGKAFRVKKKSDGKQFAAKQISKSRFYRLDKDPKRRQALLAAMQGEIDIMKRLNHKYIVNLDSVYEDKQMLWIVMEECRGGELFDRITARKRYNEPDAARVLRMILDALFYMHDHHRVVHCDLKPDNILFVDETEESAIKIIDFGMSKVLPRLRSLRELCGTPYYTAPEIIDGNYAHEADMWSVGVIAFVMLFGYPPFYVNPNQYYGKAEADAIYDLIQKGFSPVVKKGYGPFFPKKFPTSDEAKDFMAHTKENEEVVSREVFTEIAKFTNNCNFKIAVIQLFRSQFEQMRPAHFQSLKDMFKKLDKDGNGTISYEEFEEGMLQMKDLKISKQRIKEMFGELDVGATGEIRFDELLNAAVHDYLVSSDERLYQAFRELDDDDDGIILVEQLKTKLKETDPYGQYSEMLKTIDDADLDKDGKVNYEEFLRALHPDFNEQPAWFWEDKKKV
ncbi:calmodulin-dependent protein kinase [Reticulomyxa filosa]|uniref:Calmodulin-dependent protein kinase n=1 Tax=Reticulomyxa filosa TaxID=46433 RepID=X6M7U5_RETFI|nr:calmodulin-dependent protein kinase [Reticulomyxa filosa]|eukprot:ETO10053.1 calmodulin-dependent protein kinase [Reticulomyxa filosa]